MRLGLSQGTEFFDTMSEWHASIFRGNMQTNHLEYRKKMCDKGKYLFESFLKSKTVNSTFLVHIVMPKEEGGCLVCRKPFFDFLEKEVRSTNDLYSCAHG